MAFPRFRSKSALPSTKSFAILMSIVFAIYALGPLFKEGSPRYFAFGIAFLFVLTSFKSEVLVPLLMLWMWFADFLNFFIQPLVLSLLFFLGFFPLGVMGRAFGWLKFNRSWKTTLASYWVKSERNSYDEAFFRRQF